MKKFIRTNDLVDSTKFLLGQPFNVVAIMLFGQHNILLFQVTVLVYFNK